MTEDTSQDTFNTFCSIWNTSRKPCFTKRHKLEMFHNWLQYRYIYLFSSFASWMDMSCIGTRLCVLPETCLKASFTWHSSHAYVSSPKYCFILSWKTFIIVYTQSTRLQKVAMTHFFTVQANIEPNFLKWQCKRIPYSWHNSSFFLLFLKDCT